MRPISRSTSFVAVVAMGVLFAGCAAAGGGSPASSSASPGSNASSVVTFPSIPSSSPSPQPSCACTSVPSDSPTTYSYSHDPSVLVLRISVTGGLVPPGFLFTDLPAFSLYGDGRVIVRGATAAIYPGPAVPSLTQFTLDSRQMADLLVAADLAGLFGHDAHYDYGRIADGTTTVFESQVNGHHTISAYALAEAGDATSGMPSGDAEARARLAAFAAQAMQLVLNPPAPAPLVSAYVPVSVRLLVRSYSGDGSGATPQPSVGWPLAAVPLGSFGTAGNGGQIGRLDGSDAATFLAAAASTNVLTPWRDHGVEYAISIRPLLPDETGASDVINPR